MSKLQTPEGPAAEVEMKKAPDGLRGESLMEPQLVAVVCPGSGATAGVHVGLSDREAEAGCWAPPQDINAPASVATEIAGNNADQSIDFAIASLRVDRDFCLLADSGRLKTS
jgi:hypothetical protein